MIVTPMRMLNFGSDIRTESAKTDYLIAVQAPAFSLGAGRFATESAFAAHLKELKLALGSTFRRIVVIAPTFSEQHYKENRAILGELSAELDEITFVPAFDLATTPRLFWTKEVGSLYRRLRPAFADAGVLHSGLASDIWEPYLVLVNLLAFFKRVPILFVVDIDFRQLSRRYYMSGVWNRKSYLINRCLHDPFKYIQVWLAVRACNLVLLKSPSMVAAFGSRQANVKDFLDAAHSAADVISDERLEAKLVSRRGEHRRLEVVYFGRFVPYKGLDCIIEAVHLAVDQGAKINLTLIGTGECEGRLRQEVISRGLGDTVTFAPMVKYGPPLFQLVDRADVAVAAPKVEDTPRAALDAMARGLPIVAFDIDYFLNLSEKSGAIALAQWASPESLADRLVMLQNDRAIVERMARNAVAFARNNTQEFWLNKRVRWMLEAINIKPERPETVSNASANRRLS